MKKFLSLLVLVIAFFTSQSQTATQFPLVAGDTVVNTATVSKTFKMTAGYSGAAIQILGIKNSGTVGGTISVLGSLDGTNYDLIGSAYTATDIATNIKSFYVTAPVPVYIKVQWVGSGTMNATFRVSYVLRKYAHQ